MIAGMLIFLAAPAKAQLSVGIDINISSQPTWGPVGYDNVQYYYIPDIDAYYYVPQHLFWFQSGGVWISSSNLPPQYSNYDLYGGYKVVINSDRPYMHDQDYRVKYSSYRGRHDQAVIRDSHDSKYSAVNNHNAHTTPVKQQVRVTNKNNKQAPGNKKAQGNKQAQGNKKVQGNQPGQSNKQSRGNKPGQSGKQTQGNKQAQGKESDKRK
jgi:hypothetical protein